MKKPQKQSYSGEKPIYSFVGQMELSDEEKRKQDFWKLKTEEDRIHQQNSRKLDIKIGIMIEIHAET